MQTPSLTRAQICLQHLLDQRAGEGIVLGRVRLDQVPLDRGSEGILHRSLVELEHLCQQLAVSSVRPRTAAASSTARVSAG